MEFHPDIPISQRHLFNNSKCSNCWPALSFGSKNASASLGWSSLWKYWPWHTSRFLITAFCLFLQPNFLTSWESFKAERVCETWSVCANNPPKDIKIVPQGLRVTHSSSQFQFFLHPSMSINTWPPPFSKFLQKEGLKIVSLPNTCVCQKKS